MANLFEKIEGVSSTSTTINTLVDTTQNFKVDKYKNWYCTVFYTVSGVTYSHNVKIVSNTSNTLTFAKNVSFPSVVNYEIAFVNRFDLNEIESDSVNQLKITDELIRFKYRQVNIDLSNKVFSYLRGLYKENFDPLTKISNLEVLKQVYCYSLLSKIYQDLSLDQDSFESFKGYNMYEKSYLEGVKDALALLQIDTNDDGTISAEEIAKSASTFVFMSR